MMRKAISLVMVWRPAVRTTGDLQATVTLDRVKPQGRAVSLALHLVHFKTVFGIVVVDRLRVTHRGDGRTETPSAEAWGTAHRCKITRGLRGAVCDPMLDESAGAARQDVGLVAGEPDLVCRFTVLNLIHEEGAAPKIS